MVTLAKIPQLIRGRGDQGILKAFLQIQADGYLQNAPATGLQHPVNLVHGSLIFKYMLQHMAAQNHIEAALRTRDGPDVHFDGFCILWHQVPRQIIDRRFLADPFP
ncbi:Uncharacterised protein [Mycobacteroides abscessus subsp. abscessus]|nr:Uncharacterised protein [Mycobacteroides abscessus subsp. abscessus]